MAKIDAMNKMIANKIAETKKFIDDNQDNINQFIEDTKAVI